MNYIISIMSVLNKYNLFFNKELSQVLFSIIICIELVKKLDPNWQTNVQSVIKNFSKIYKAIEIE